MCASSLVLSNRSVGWDDMIMWRTNFCHVVCSTKNKLWRPIIPWADVWDIRLILYQYLGTAKIAELKYAGGRVEQQILGLDVSMADSLWVYVRERTEKLIDVKLDFQYGHYCLHLIKVTWRTVYGFGDEFEDEIEVDFILLKQVILSAAEPCITVLCDHLLEDVICQAVAIDACLTRSPLL